MGRGARALSDVPFPFPLSYCGCLRPAGWLWGERGRWVECVPAGAGFHVSPKTLLSWRDCSEGLCLTFFVRERAHLLEGKAPMAEAGGCTASWT